MMRRGAHTWLVAGEGTDEDLGTWCSAAATATATADRTPAYKVACEACLNAAAIFVPTSRKASHPLAASTATGPQPTAQQLVVPLLVLAPFLVVIFFLFFSSFSFELRLNRVLA